MTAFCRRFIPKKYFGTTVFLAVIHVVLFGFYISGMKNIVEFCQSMNAEQQAMNRIDPSDIPENGIYFLETSGLPMLSPKQLCAVESAALHHPNRSVVVAVKNKFLQLPSVVKSWSEKYPNIMFTTIDIVQWLNGTILQPWLSKNLLENSTYKTVHMSDILRYVTMFKYGGLYLDTDVVVMKPMDELVNAVGLEGTGVINNAVLAFEKHHLFMEACLKELSEKYDPYNWGSNGPGMLTRIIRPYCGWNITDPVKPGDCKNIKVLNISAFYPVKYASWRSMFNHAPIISASILKKAKQSYTLHYWNRKTVDEPIQVGTPQALGVLAAKHCPLVSASIDNGELWGLNMKYINKS
ncbi:unnamed protein product [Notodromas monacha]|uniref:Alpha 1,4-glycosyltransferase domain-containing protein n=1 Tax=Notodromas monacha TaxID=399045 RepID=A0A7R9GCH8_9CRUS|nr:unnamed protein product [Notodromas monacha]CAG0915857.1 unnamed protein product [Notodromas monacha]